ncbi:MAG: ExbD/TolR family protein [Burkholderiales bacterium]|jgi:biopolymer transport protein TolR|nr:ExbD/TolR family protein [Burkholderiales bacterium]
MRRPRKAINQMNVVPYIDVMLVLLVIFMVTAPLIAPGEIELPNIGTAPSSPKQPMEVTVRANGTLWLRNRADPKVPIQQVSPEVLVEKITEAQKSNANQSVVIAGDKSVRYESIISVLDLLQKNKVNKVGLLVVPNQAGTATP